ncbi:helix-turn-helix transcriptional regulator [Fructobacillus ficulneus]|uniref:DNA-binding helix-turn-helix protein n=1 Tax=Fructobacillus ficulneus TaxID=157463 RepID=A0A0K8MFK4_9LACO|nr:helix-turn-helix transcriptional regulator [Fructobacillus ficulneus]GAO99290.1 DNA-binding helix-turn-helix protein [Fructobacillus ficulneus]
MNRLKELRQDKKYSLATVSKLLKDNYDLSVSPATLMRYENGKTDPKLVTWQKLADIFNVPIGFIQGVSNIPTNHISDGYEFYQDTKKHGTSTSSKKNNDDEDEGLNDVHLNQFNKLMQMFGYGNEWGTFDDIDKASRLEVVKSIDASFSNGLATFSDAKNHSGSSDKANIYLQKYAQKVGMYNPYWWDASDLSSPLSVEDDVYYKNKKLTPEQREQVTNLLNSFID